MRIRSLVLVALLARLAPAQATDTTHRVSGASVTGIVRDSLAHAPLAEAMVQLVAADRPARFSRTTTSDSLGRFTLRDVPDGRYLIGFFHPLLDSLGLEPPLREVDVVAQRPMRVDLATPSAARLRAAICGGATAAESLGVVVGSVHDARDGMPVAGATVAGEWLELSFTRGGVVRRTPRLAATTGGNGWFALCDLPSGATMTLLASRGADSTDVIEVQMPADGFARRELYLGAARTVVVADSTPADDGAVRRPRSYRAGDARLTGVVVAAAGGEPVRGASVSVAGGPAMRANDRGEWTLADVPAGTRVLEVRALGYYPSRRAVDVVAGAAPIRVALPTVKAVLDTIRVTARASLDLQRRGFDERRRTGAGRYLSPDDLARRLLVATSDLFRNVAGVELWRDGAVTRLAMRGPMGICWPSIYIDGHYYAGADVTIDDLDTWVRPAEIAGIEIYSEVSLPAQLRQALDPCGAVVVWTK